MWLTEGYSSDMYNLTQRATYPLASYIEGDIAERSVYQLGFGHVFGHHTSIPLLLRVCNVNILPSGDDGNFNRTAEYIDGHWRQVWLMPISLRVVLPTILLLATTSVMRAALLHRKTYH